MGGGSSIKSFLLYLSTISFWTEHHAAWFVALLIPLYFIAPFLFFFLRNNKKSKTILLLCLCFIISIIPTNNNAIIENIQFVMPRVPCFILGFALGELIKDKKKVRLYWVTSSILAAIIALIITKRFVYTYFFMLIPIMLFFCYILNFLKLYWFKKLCTFFGKISFESYLINGSIQFYIAKLVTTISIKDDNNIIFYLLVILIGTAVATLYNIISSLLISRIKFINRVYR